MTWISTDKLAFSPEAVDHANAQAERMRAVFKAQDAAEVPEPTIDASLHLDLGSFVAIQTVDTETITAMLEAHGLSFRHYN